MSYCISQTDSQFGICFELMSDATKALRKWCAKYNDPKTCSCCGQTLPTKEQNFAEMMEELHFNVEFNHAGSVVDMTFEGENLYDNLEVVMQVIAPFVIEGSYLQFCGESTDNWRYIFKDGKMKEVHAKPVWFDEDEEE